MSNPFEVQSAYLEGRADFAEAVVKIVEHGRNNPSVTKDGLCCRILAVIGKTEPE